MVSENVTRKTDSLGRITLPKGLRDRLGINIGDELEILTEGNIICLRQVDKTSAQSELEELLRQSLSNPDNVQIKDLVKQINEIVNKE